MIEAEYTRLRLHITEAALCALIEIVIEILPPRLVGEINRMGLEWEKEIDALEAEFKSKEDAQEPSEQQAQSSAREGAERSGK